MITTEEYVVTAYVKGVSNNGIYYIGLSKFEAYKTYREIKNKGNARIVWARVRREFTQLIDYKIIKIVKQDYSKIIRDWELDVSIANVFDDYDEEYFQQKETYKEMVEEFCGEIEQKKTKIREYEELSQALFEEYYAKWQVILEGGTSVERIWSECNRLLEELHENEYARDIVGFLLCDIGNILFMEGLMKEGSMYMKEAEEYVDTSYVDDILVYARLTQHAFSDGVTQEGITHLRRAIDGLPDCERAFQERNMKEEWCLMKAYL